jgi:hypothetical protein
MNEVEILVWTVLIITTLALWVGWLGDLEEATINIHRNKMKFDHWDQIDLYWEQLQEDYRWMELFESRYGRYKDYT